MALHSLPVVAAGAHGRSFGLRVSTYVPDREKPPLSGITFWWLIPRARGPRDRVICGAAISAEHGGLSAP